MEESLTWYSSASSSFGLPWNPQSKFYMSRRFQIINFNRSLLDLDCNSFSLLSFWCHNPMKLGIVNKLALVNKFIIIVRLRNLRFLSRNTHVKYLRTKNLKLGDIVVKGHKFDI